MSVHNFTYNGHNSSEFGVYIKKNGMSYTHGEHDFNKIVIPGKDGITLIDNGRWENDTITYKCIIMPIFSFNNFKEQTSAISNWLYNNTGVYHTLTDSYGHNKEALFISKIEFSIVEYGSEISLEFSCKHQEGD